MLGTVSHWFCGADLKISEGLIFLACKDDQFYSNGECRKKCTEDEIRINNDCMKSKRRSCDFQPVRGGQVGVAIPVTQSKVPQAGAAGYIPGHIEPRRYRDKEPPPLAGFELPPSSIQA